MWILEVNQTFRTNGEVQEDVMVSWARDNCELLLIEKFTMSDTSHQSNRIRVQVEARTVSSTGPSRFAPQ
jgi:hypothetical protein